MWEGSRYALWGTVRPSSPKRWRSSREPWSTSRTSTTRDRRWIWLSSSWRTPFADRVFFCNSGAEANEAAIKIARRYTREKVGPGKHTIICMQGSFHGRTMATLSATGQSKVQIGYDPLLEGFKFVPFNDLAALRNGRG